MQRITELSRKPKSSQTTKDSRPISRITTIIQQADITIEVDITVKESIITKVDTKIIMEEDQNVRYAINITIAAQNSHPKIGLT